MSEEEKSLLRKIVREELDKTEWKLSDESIDALKPKEVKPVEPTEKCEGCGAIIKGKPEYCPGCDGELDWPE